MSTILDKITILNELLGMHCKETAQPIRLGVPVAQFDWGQNNHNRIIAWGRFEWDDQEKAITFTMNKDMSIILDVDNPTYVEDRYDMFCKATYRLATQEELEEIQHLNR